MNLHHWLNCFAKPARRRRHQRSNTSQAGEVCEDRCLLTAGTGQFLGGQILDGFAAADVALGDIDGDGDLDAFFAIANTNASPDGGHAGGAADWTAAPNRVFLNNGGVFTDSGQTLGNEISLSVELGDLDGDGDLDAFVGNAGPDSIWLNDGSGNFTNSGLALGNGFSIGVELSDLNGDGVLDIAVTNTDVIPGLDTKGAVWINQGVAPLSYTNTGSNLWGIESSSEIALGDVDGNGTIDAVVTQFSADGPGTGANRIFLNDGSGTFTDSGNTFATMSSLGVGLADFDGDNDLDIFIADDDLLEGDRVYINQGGSQGGTEGVFVDSGQRLGAGRYAVRVDIADFDGDGDPDVFVTPSGESPVSGAHVFINQGGVQGGVAGEFASNGQSLGVGDNPGVALGDIDGNGTIDAITADIDGFSRVWLNQEIQVINYAANGNVSIDVPASGGLLADAPVGVTIETVNYSGTRGVVNFLVDGSFTYTPATGFFGTDTFVIDRSDGETRTVAINVGRPIWFVDQNAASGGDGSLAAPFQSFAPLNDDGFDPDSDHDLIHINGNGSYDVNSSGGFFLEPGQTLITSHHDPFSVPDFMLHIGHPLAPFSVGLPTGFTGRPELYNSVSGAPVLKVSGENFITSFNINPAGASEAVLGVEATGRVSLHNIDVIPGPGDHSYDGLALYNSNVDLYLYSFVIGNQENSTTSGTALYIDGGDSVTLQASVNTRVFQRGGGLLNVTNTTNSTGEGGVVFNPDTSLWIDGGDFGFNLQNNDNGKFGFDGDFFLIDVTTGITAINSGTIEMPKDANPAQRDVSTNGGFALQVEHTITGVDGWHLDEVNSWGGTGGILFDDVAGGGIHINRTEIVSATDLAVDVSDTPNTVFDFGELMIMGDDLVTQTWVGNGTAGRAGDGGNSNDAELNMPSDVTFDRHGNMFITDFAENVVRRMDVVTETMTTIAGTGTAGFSGDGGLATSAKLNGPLAVVVDDEGNVFIADSGNHRIRRIDAATGIITTMAGTGTGGFGGDNGPATSASLNFPVDLVFASDGSLFVSDHENHRIRRIDGDTGIITTAVGTGEAGISPEDTPPASAMLNLPWGIAFIANGELGIADSGNNRVVGVDWDDNTVFTMVGTGVPGNNGDQNNDARQFQLDDPRGLAVHPDGVILITDYNNHRVIGFDPLEESVETLAGNGTAGYAGDNTPVQNAQFNEPISVAVAPQGDIAVADVLNHRVRAFFFDFSSGAGVILEDNPGSTFNFERLSVRATTEAFVADNSGTINVGADPDIFGNWAMLVATNGRALDITDTTVSNGEGGPATFRHVLSGGSPGDGIVLTNVSGDLVIESGLIYDANQDGQPETAGITIEGGSGDITIYATVVNYSGQSVAISGRTSGDIHLVAPIFHDVAGTSAIVIENNIAGSTTFYRPLDINSGAAAAIVQNNNADHVVTFLTEGFPPEAPGSGVSFEDSGQLLGNLDYNTSYQATGVALGDLDGDGDLDAFIVNRNHSLIHGPEPDTGEPNRVFLNNNGIFTDSGQTLGNEISSHVKLGDFDNDGDLDAFVVNFGANELWLNDGHGTFTNSGQILGSGNSIDVAIGDIDGDGDLDVVVANITDGSTPGGEVWINQGIHTGTFVNIATTTWNTMSAVGIDLGDVDGDGDLDVFVSQEFQDTFEADGVTPIAIGAGVERLLLNQGDGTFVDSGQSLGAAYSFGVVLADFDRDGDLDAFVTGGRAFPPGSEPDGVRAPNRYFVNMGGAQGGTEGVFGTPVQIFHDNQDQSRVAAADLDGDGDIDVFVANVKDTLESADGQNRVYVNQGGLQGGTEGTFADNGQQLGNSHSDSVALGDVNGDGKIDAFVSNGGSPSRVWLNTSVVLPSRTIDVADFERIATLGSFVASSGTEFEIGAGETVELQIDLEADQVLSGLLDSFASGSPANLTVEVVGLTSVLSREEFVEWPATSVETSGTYTVRVTSDKAATMELVLFLNAGFEVPDSSDGNELAIDNTHGGGTSGRWAAVGISDGSTTVPDVDEFTIDLTEYVGQSIDVIVTGFEGQHYEGQTLELLAPNGTTVLRTGTATPVGGVNATNLDLAIFDFEVPAAGVYTARVTAAFDDVAYTVVVTYGVTFDTEPNNDRNNDSLRSITPNEVALGHLDATTDAADFYEIELTAGQSVNLYTMFAFNADLSPINTLNPELEVFRPNGTSLATDADSSEGVHAEIAFTATVTGTYVVRVGATAGAGDYVLQAELSATPIVTNASTNEDTQTTTGLVISHERTEVTHFKITNVTGGTLFQNNGTTGISNGAFITVAQANAGLKFTPSPNSIATGHFTVQASTSNVDSGLSSSTVIADITVNPVADTPSVTAATTQVNVQTTTGLVIGRNAVDGAEVTHFKITSITGGTLFQNNGTTPISNGDFITFAQANAGLKFTPSLNSGTTGHFTVRASVSNLDSGLGGNAVTANITVNVTLAAPLITAPTAATTAQRPTITWSPIAGAASYEVWITGLSTNTNPLVQATPTTASYLPTVDLGIGQFRLWVRAKASNGTLSAWSLARDFQITTAAVFNTPAAQQSTFRPTLTWTALPGADHYDIWINNLSTGTNQIVRETNVATTSFTAVADLPIGQYQAWVRGIAADGYAANWSTPVTFSIAVAPTITQGQNAVFKGIPTITWNALPGADHYDIWINNLSTGERQVVRNMDVASTTFTGSGSLPIGRYQAWVSGIAADDYATNWSTPVTFSISFAPTITQGQNAVFDRIPTITWDALPGADHYDIWINNFSTGERQIVRDTNVESTTFTGSNTLPIGQYQAWVRGIAEDGYEATWTVGVNFTISGAPTATPGLNSTFDRTPTFAWDALPGASTFKFVLRNLTTGATTLNQENIAATQFTPTSDLADGPYRWWVRGKTAEGFISKWSVPVDIYVGGRPSLLTPSGTTSNTTPTFSWKPVDGADHYDLWVSRLGGPHQIIRQSALTTTTFTPTSALPAGTYRAWVQAVSTTGELSLWSEFITFTVA